MRKIMLIAAALSVGAVGVSQITAAQDVNPKKAATGENQATTEEMKVTGMVTKADEQTGEITIADKTLVMEGGEAGFPQVGGKVTAFYENRGGKNVITRIGQAQ
jgi:ethanolamine utilization protein EutP (predicted NTPase)